MGDKVDQLTVETKDRREESSAEPVGALGDGIEDTLQLRRRAGDHAQDVACRCLMLDGSVQSLCQAIYFTPQIGMGQR
jgi:hypothetical protein